MCSSDLRILSGASDEWANHPDGVYIERLSGATYNAHVMVVRDPSKVFMGWRYSCLMVFMGFPAFSFLDFIYYSILKAVVYLLHAFYERISKIPAQAGQVFSYY